MRDYQLVSPSLEGILRHSSIAYEGIDRPIEILQMMEGPATRGNKKESFVASDPYTSHEKKIIAQYFQDLQSVFMKKISSFIVADEPGYDEPVKLQAMLQEIIKIKNLLGKI